MSTLKLRGLAKAYSDGLIDRKQYIHERRQLIDGIVAGELEITPYEAPEPAAAAPVERTFSDGEATLEMPNPESEVETIPVTPVKPRRSGRTLVLSLFGVAALAYAAWHMMGRVDSETPTTPAMSTTEIPETPNPAGVLLDGFLDENTWLPQRIEGFMLAWEQEPLAAREALEDTPTMRRAADLITQQIIEEKALFELGERDTALRKQRRLFDLADALSIENERISRQETEWAEHHDALVAARTAAAEPEAADAGAEAPDVATASEPVAASGLAIATPETAASAPATESAGASALEIAAQQEPEAAPEPAPEADTANEDASAEPATAPATTAADDNGASAIAATPTTPASPRLTEQATKPTASAGDGDAATGAAAKTAISAKSSPKRKGCRASLAKQRRPYCRDPLGKNLNGPTLAVLPAGRAELGGNKPSEQPKYTVEIKRPFALGVFEVSNAEFSAFCQATKQACPSQPWSDPDFPVVNVSWSLAGKYTEWLSEITNARYRLPSEAEWEYAARAGTRSPYPFGDEVLPTHARFSFRGIESTPVAANDRTVNRNKFRLYHMIGNVREWVLDAWHDNHAGAAADGGARIGDASAARVARGGSYSDGADQVRSASRVRIDGDRGDAQTGFRVLREVE